MLYQPPIAARTLEQIPTFTTINSFSEFSGRSHLKTTFGECFKQILEDWTCYIQYISNMDASDGFGEYYFVL